MRRRRPCVVVARGSLAPAGRGRFFSCSVSSCGEKDRGDVAEVTYCTDTMINSVHWYRPVSQTLEDRMLNSHLIQVLD
ncbi:hypothetical protein GW17_00046907 [Ensete ventricosum]|nr:hypothetical protein GW17_00046907 [Ensete ventricosum]